jgi:hypothetical protein
VCIFIAGGQEADSPPAVLAAAADLYRDFIHVLEELYCPLL